MVISLDRVTVQDCMEMDQLKGAGAILAGGHLRGFIYDRGKKADSHQAGKKDERTRIPLLCGKFCGRLPAGA